MTNAKTQYRLGLDLGTNSIGWAAVELDLNGEPCGIVDMGVRIFPDGRDEKRKQSNAVDRRMARGQRRRRDRYLIRRSRLMQALINSGLMPGNADERRELELADPYDLRAQALAKPLGPFELGRALFHLNQRRGFKSNRKASDDKEDEKEDGQVHAAISNLRQRMEETQARTLGEFLAQERQRGNQARARPETGLRADRQMYEKEFQAIRSAQEGHQELTAEQWDKLFGIIFYQRPLRPVDPGRCLFEYESGEPRAPKATPIFQEFRMLQEVNNLKVRVGAEPERFLTPDERARAMKMLRSGKDIKLNSPSKDLGLPSGAQFNLAAGGRASIKGDETTAKLASTGKKPTNKRPAQHARFGKTWFDFSLEKRNKIVRFLLDTEEPSQVREKAIHDWGLTDEQADAVATVALPEGYGNLSEKAIIKILPHLERGMMLWDAVQAAGYPHHSDFRNDEAHDSLPYYGVVLERDAVGADPTKDPERDGAVARYGRLGNPTVHIGLGQLRRVVNLLIETYGKPQEIVVELVRELKMNDAQKMNHQRQQREGAARNERFAEMLTGAGLVVSAGGLRKLRLWEEQGPIHNRVCPYTGQQISVAMAMSAQTEIDHILPFSRTLDNSMGNLVLCLADANRKKGNLTPHEKWPDGRCLEYVATFTGRGKEKIWRFQKDAMERFEGDRDFLDRQLNETQYLSRAARAYLAYLYDELGEHRQRVRVIPGRMTALLRRGWELEGMLNNTGDSAIPRKTRDDHRHHAVDAFVVANTTQGLLQRFANAAGSGYREAEQRLASLVPLPWEGFDRAQVQERLDRLVVSYKPDHGTLGEKGKTTGKLHDATAHGLVELVNEVDGRYRTVSRKALTKFEAKDLKHVTDVPLREALRRLWDETGGKKSDFARQAADPGVLLASGHRQRVRGVRIYSVQRVIPVKDAAGNAYKGYLPDGNEYPDVWRNPDGKWQTMIMSTFDANQPKIDANQPGLYSNGRRRHPAARHLMRLQINDMGALGEGANRRIVRVRKIINRTGKTPTVVLDDHKDANAAKGKDIEFSAKKLEENAFRKVRVDEIGRVFDRGPFR